MHRTRTAVVVAAMMMLAADRRSRDLSWRPGDVPCVAHPAQQVHLRQTELLDFSDPSIRQIIEDRSWAPSAMSLTAGLRGTRWDVVGQRSPAVRDAYVTNVTENCGVFFDLGRGSQDLSLSDEQPPRVTGNARPVLSPLRS